MYTYAAYLRRPEDAYDGDTVRLDVSLGFHAWMSSQSFRLLGIDTPEIRGGTDESKAAAKVSRRRLLELIEEHGIVDADGVCLTIRTHRDEQGKYGRWLCEILTLDRADTLNAILLREGLARAYP